MTFSSHGAGNRAAIQCFLTIGAGSLRTDGVLSVSIAVESIRRWFHSAGAERRAADLAAGALWGMDMALAARRERPVTSVVAGQDAVASLRLGLIERAVGPLAQ